MSWKGSLCSLFISTVKTRPTCTKCKMDMRLAGMLFYRLQPQRELWPMTVELAAVILSFGGICLGIFMNGGQNYFPPSSSVTCWRRGFVSVRVAGSRSGEWLLADWAWIKVKDLLHLPWNRLSVWGCRQSCDGQKNSYSSRESSWHWAFLSSCLWWLDNYNTSLSERFAADKVLL